MEHRHTWILVLLCFITLSTLRTVALSNSIYESYFPWKQNHIIPVIHNLEAFQVPFLIDALDGIKCCTVSLRHSEALSSLKNLTEQFGPYCDVGISTVVATSQIAEAESNGALFVSTMFNSRALINQSKQNGMPILCGVSSLVEARQALSWGAEALKFYPATEFRPKTLGEIINELKYDGSLAAANVTDLIVAGGVLEIDYHAYLAAGATNFAIGFDCKKMAPSQIKLKLRELNKLYLSLKQSA